MNNLLFGLFLSAILSSFSLIIILLRVSPLTAATQAIPSFFVSLFLCISTISSLCLIALWKKIQIHTWDSGKLIGISLRQGSFVGSSAMIILLFHLLELLNWWIALMIFGVFLLVELGLEH